MAGAGYKLFATGDVLTAAQVNTYLNEQTVMVFASSAARTSALSGVLAEGMMSYLQDTNAVEVYNGTAWVSVGGGGGDVTEVQAGVGISVASGTGPIPIITNSSTDLITTAGDILYGTAADTVARLGIGTAGQVLKVNSGATAPEWGAAAAGGMTVIASGSIANSATGFSITSIPATYYNLQLVIRNSNSGALNINSRLRVNNLSTSIYSKMANYGSITTAGAATAQADSNILLDFENSARNADESIYVINFWDYAGNSFKSGTITGYHGIQTGPNFEIYTGSFGVRTTSALDRIDLITGSANTFAAAGTYTLYGVK